jgi:hypothetical protein
VEDLAGLECSVARKDAAVKAGVEQSLLQEGGAEGPTAVGAFE